MANATQAIAPLDVAIDCHFEWDPIKARRNLAKHGVGFDEAGTAFNDPLGRMRDDPRHSFGERRQVLLALSSRARLLVVMFTVREPALRLISARLATRAERIRYEEANS